MSDPIEAATKFDEAVRATSAVGGLIAEVSSMKGDIVEIKSDAKEMREDVKHIRRNMDNWAGRATILGAVLSLAASVMVAIWGQPLARAIASLVAQ